MAIFKRLSLGQQISLTLTLLLIILLPVTLLTSQKTTKTKSKAYYQNNSSVLTSVPTLAAGLSTTDSSWEKAIQFDGLSYASVSAQINPQLGFTAEAWIKPNSPNFSSNIINREDGLQNSFGIYVQSGLAPNSSNYGVTYQFSVVNSGNNCAYHSLTNYRYNLSSAEVTS